MTVSPNARHWELAAWKVTAWRAAIGGLVLLVLIFVIGLASRGHAAAALGSAVFFGADFVFGWSIVRTEITSLRWHGSKIEWQGLLGNSGSVEGDDIVGVTSGIQPGRTLIKLKSRPPLRVTGWRLREVGELVAAAVD
jgi:hypothetical protein